MPSDCPIGPIPSSVELALARSVAGAGARLAGQVREKRRKERIRKSTRALIPTAVAERLPEELSDAEAVGLSRYLDSPDFEEIALQVSLVRLLGDQKWD